ncbi:hypothetical protein [Streptomyces sp. NPDC088915]|uniref:hypothetical protein n=1 Tax=Streptomyces sp. NPDC088915 TaxID=3365912 RepID=UPI0037FA67DC
MNLHTDNTTENDTTLAPAAKVDVYDPAPGTEYPYVISDYAREAARILGDGWGADSGFIGAYGLLWGPDVPTLHVFVDHCFPDQVDLVVAPYYNPDPQMFTINLPDGAPQTREELRTVAEQIAEIARSLQP